MQNYVLKSRDELSQNNYLRKADPAASYWFDFSQDKLLGYFDQLGDDFSIIIAGSESVEGDFFVVPFTAIKHMLKQEYLSEDQDDRKRWIGRIKYNKLVVNNCPTFLDISSFYGRLLPTSDGVPTDTSIVQDKEQHDYAIENIKREIEARQKQSLFRKKVLKNFDSRCCLTGIRESDLLVASHVIPWVDRVETRLDPGNGLCLSILYDKLFDKGYISFNDHHEVIATSKLAALSSELQKTLDSIAGVKMSEPKSHPIEQEYLKYHRNSIFKAKFFRVTQPLRVRPAR